MTIKVVTENDVDNVTIIINDENKISCVPQQPAKVFTDEYNVLMDACECGAFITRQTSEGQAVVVDYVKFTGKYTKTFVGTDAKDVVYRGIYSSSGKEVLVNKEKTTVIYDGEGSPVIEVSGSFIKPVTLRLTSIIDPEGGVTYVETYPELDALKDYTYEALDCCNTGATSGIEIEELPYTEFVDDNNVPNDYALRLVVGNQEVGIDKIGVIKGTQWLVFKASKVDLTQPVA